jgi:hypothetical protein
MLQRFFSGVPLATIQIMQNQPANYAAVQGLNKMNPTKDKTLRFGYLDKLENTVRVISASEFVSVAFVLPTVKSGTASFPNSLDSAKWYIVMPPCNDWQNMGWPNCL